MPVDVVIIGARGHAKVIADIVLKNRDNLLGFLDDNKGKGGLVLRYPILGKVDCIYSFSVNTKFIIGIGDNFIRKSIADKYDVEWYSAIHPSAIIGIDVIVKTETVIMADTVINASAKLGKHCIINTGAIVEHDDIISAYVHISPNTSLGGTVNVGECTHVGIGASVKSSINITSDCVIGAGAVIVKDIIECGVYTGMPAKKIR